MSVNMRRPVTGNLSARTAAQIRAVAVVAPQRDAAVRLLPDLEPVG